MASVRVHPAAVAAEDMISALAELVLIVNAAVKGGNGGVITVGISLYISRSMVIQYEWMFSHLRQINVAHRNLDAQRQLLLHTLTGVFP